MATIQFQNTPYRTEGDLPSMGSRAPDFSLVNMRLQDVTFANWQGERKILNIFVSIDTPVCANSVLEFEQRADGVENLAVLHISCDMPFAFKRFVEANELEDVDALSSVRHAGFGENYGVEITSGPLAKMFARAVVVLDENNTVVHAESIEDIATEPDYEAAFKALGVST
ncbi:MAG: thiol peroxidase [Pseudomonadota bacterium]